MRRPKPPAKPTSWPIRAVLVCLVLGLLLLAYKQVHSRQSATPVAQVANKAHDVAPFLNSSVHNHAKTTANVTAETVRLSAAQLKQAASKIVTPAGRYPVSEKDLLIAFPADQQHLPIVQAGRQWHQGIKTVVAINDPSLVSRYAADAGTVNEVWVDYPDDTPPLKAKFPGDPRAAFTPWLAHKAVGGLGYKWILYGDDDTVWFVDNTLKLLKDLDPQMPYIISDNLWWSDVEGTIGNQPNLRAPRCLPCNHSSSEFGDLVKQRPFNAPIGCPCTAEQLCNAPDLADYFDDDCSIPRHGVRTYSIHGGAGAIISIGLMKAISYEWMEECLSKEQAPGGDGLLMACLWRAGYAVTDPGFSFYHPELRMFDPVSQEGRQLLYAFTEGLSGGCDASCQTLLSHVVTSHVRSAVHGIPAGASMIRAMSNIYKLYMQHTR